MATRLRAIVMPLLLSQRPARFRGRASVVAAWNLVELGRQGAGRHEGVGVDVAGAEGY